MSDDPFPFDPIIAAFFEKEARNVEDYERDLHDPIVALRTDLAAMTKRAEEAERNLEICRDALERSVLALDDWIHTFAPEHCNKDDVARTTSRIWNQGGTLAYIAKVQHENREALKQENGSPKIAVAWLILNYDGRTDLVLSPLTDDTYMEEGDEAWPLYNDEALAALAARGKNG